jgi:hypothetical protein
MSPCSKDALVLAIADIAAYLVGSEELGTLEIDDDWEPKCKKSMGSQWNLPGIGCMGREDLEKFHARYRANKERKRSAGFICEVPTQFPPSSSNDITKCATNNASARVAEGDGSNANVMTPTIRGRRSNGLESKIALFDSDDNDRLVHKQTSNNSTSLFHAQSVSR